jgi:hypothetical protein
MNNFDRVQFLFQLFFFSDTKRVLHLIIKGYHNLDEDGLKGGYPWVEKGHDLQASH